MQADIHDLLTSGGFIVARADAESAGTGTGSAVVAAGGVVSL